jgi:hypothetical protein
MLLIAIAFFINAFVTGILFGSTTIQYLLETGWNPSAFGLYSLAIGLGLKIVFTILIAIRLYLLHEEIK